VDATPRDLKVCGHLEKYIYRSDLSCNALLEEVTAKLKLQATRPSYVVFLFSHNEHTQFKIWNELGHIGAADGTREVQKARAHEWRKCAKSQIRKMPKALMFLKKWAAEGGCPYINISVPFRLAQNVSNRSAEKFRFSMRDRAPVLAVRSFALQSKMFTP